MGSVYHHSYTVCNPRTKVRETRYTKKWYIEWTDHEGRVHREPGYTDRAATEHLLAERERERDRIHAGYLPPETSQVRRPLLDHLRDYLDHLRAKNNGHEHVSLVEARCRLLLESMGCSSWAELNSHQLSLALAQLRSQSPRRRAGISARTSNHYLQQFRSFTRWLACRLRVPDPLAEVRPVNPSTDRRHIRRALAEDEFSRFLSTTARSAGIVFGFTGLDRAALYVTAAWTGLRANELATLSREQMAMDGSPPTVTVLAGYSKHRREDVMPIFPAMANVIAEWLAGKEKRKLLWPGRWAKDRHSAAMIRVDLAAAGIPYRDAQGKVFDFHALRGQFVTMLARAGVPLVQAQKLARHSDPRLTTQFYTHLDVHDLGKELVKLTPPPRLLDGHPLQDAPQDRTTEGESP